MNLHVYGGGLFNLLSLIMIMITTNSGKLFENCQYGYALAANIWTEVLIRFELTGKKRARENSEDDTAIFKQRLQNVTPKNENCPMNISDYLLLQMHLQTSPDARSNVLIYITLSKTVKAQIKAMDMIIGEISDDLKRKIKDKSQII